MLLPSGLIFDSEEAVWIGGVGREHHEEHEDEYEIEEASSSCARIFHWNKQHLALSLCLSVSLRPRRLQRNRQPFKLSARSQPIQRVRVTSRQISTRDNKTFTRPPSCLVSPSRHQSAPAETRTSVYHLHQPEHLSALLLKTGPSFSVVFLVGPRQDASSRWMSACTASPAASS